MSDAPRRSVLCVDDNRDLADSEVQLLMAVGFDAVACYDGPSALLQAAAFRPDVCVIDLNMPGMDGDELALHLRAAGPPILLVAVSAMSTEECRRRVQAAGFDRHLVKPADPAQLIAIVG